MATNILNTQFSSEFRYEHISSKGHQTGAVVNSGGLTTFAIPHNLPYIPFVRIYINFPTDNNIFTLAPAPAIYYPSLFTITEFFVDTTNVNVQVASPGLWASGGILTIYYRIYAEPQAA